MTDASMIETVQSWLDRGCASWFVPAAAIREIIARNQALSERIAELEGALRECQDKLWVIHFSLRDEAEREAAINACNMATSALASLTQEPQ